MTKQKRAVLEYLEAGNRLTSLGAIRKLGCISLSSRISQLRGDGYEIKKKMIHIKKCDGSVAVVKEYWI